MAKKLRSKRQAASFDQAEHQKDALARLDDLVNAAMTFPEVREDRIRELQRAIATGEYKPTDRQIAHAILEDLQRRRDS
jgi:anti-sigma28 factor (negative regulator of flagellin synthesis)